MESKMHPFETSSFTSNSLTEEKISPNIHLNKFISKVILSKLYEENKSNQVSMKMFSKINIDKKTYLLLVKTYYMNLFNSIEKLINSVNENKNKITKNEYLSITSFYYHLLKVEKLFIYKEDLVKSLMLQKKMLTIMENYIKNQLIDENFLNDKK